MKTRLWVTFGLFAALNVAAAGEAVAEDFTFNVPVKLSNLLPNVKAMVSCFLRNSLGTTIGSGPNQQVTVGPDGSYSGTVVVKVDAWQGQRANVKKYDCYLLLQGPGDSVYGPPTGSEDWKQSKPGTSRQIMVQGDIPQ